LKTKIQATGLGIIVAGVIVTRSLAPTDIPAQFAAGSVGVLVLIFGQTFNYLHLIPGRSRAPYILSMFFGFLIFAAAMIITTVYLVLDKPDALGAADPEYNRLLEATVGRPETPCAAEAGGSVVQIFQKGWILARFSDHALFAIGRTDGGPLSWKKHNDDSESATASCDNFENQSLLEWGIRAWYCNPASSDIRNMLGSPVTSELAVWVQYQRWSGGMMVIGLPGTAVQIDTGIFLSMHGIFLKDVHNANSGVGYDVRFTANNTNKDVSCTSMWRPAARNNRGYIIPELNQALKDRNGCSLKVPPAFYIRGGPRCSIFGT
jgi:hypothetical protein